MPEIDANKLRSLVDRILALKAEADAKDEAIRAVYAQIKALGYDKTSIGKLVGYLRLPAEAREKLSDGDDHDFTMLLRAWACLPSSPTRGSA